MFFSSVLSSALEEARGSCVVIRRQNRVRTGLCLPCRATVRLQSNRLSVMHAAVHFSAASFDRHPAAELAVGTTGCVVSSPLAIACRGQQHGGHGDVWPSWLGSRWSMGIGCQTWDFGRNSGHRLSLATRERNTVARFEDFGRGAVA